MPLSFIKKLEKCYEPLLYENGVNANFEKKND